MGALETRGPDGPPDEPVALAEVITTDQLALRPSRAPDYAAENRVLLQLAETMTRAPEAVLQQLVDAARELCRAGSAGVSLLEPAESPARFRWKATSGGLGPFVGNTMPRAFSPCGTVLDENRLLLMSDPVRHFRYIEGLPVPVREALLVPFHRDGVAIGTVWVASHTAERQFDAEDARLVQSLSRFAAGATGALASARAAAEHELAGVTEMHRRLQEVDRERADFLATLTHELRNVLAPMSNAVHIVKLSPDRATRTQAREMIERQISLLNRHVDDLLDTSRLTSGKLRLEVQDLDLVTVVRVAGEAARARIEERGQRFDVECCVEPLPVRGDEVRLTQVFSNLLNNAAKYGVRGGQVRLSVQREGSEALVRVVDDGIGIEAAMLPQIFDLFVQVDRSLLKAEGGLGIGLTLVKQLTEMHGGRVSATSEGPGKGSEFRVLLPLVESAAAR